MVGNICQFSALSAAITEAVLPSVFSVKSSLELFRPDSLKSLQSIEEDKPKAWYFSISGSVSCAWTIVLFKEPAPLIVRCEGNSVFSVHMKRHFKVLLSLAVICTRNISVSRCKINICFNEFMSYTKTGYSADEFVILCQTQISFPKSLTLT